MTKPPPHTPSDKLIDAAITWSEEGVPTSTRHGDVYFNRTDPMGEVRHVFLDGCDLPSAWRGRESHLIAETGFGTGLNFLMAWDLWRRERRAHPDETPQRLEFASVEAAPLGTAELERAHDAFPPLADLARSLRAQYPPRLPGWHRLEFRDNEADGHIMLLLGFGDAETRFAEMDFRARSWFLDGFAPSRNPDMWTSALFTRIARLSDREPPDSTTRIASFTAAGIVRRGLAGVGFEVAKRPGFGSKRDSIHGAIKPTAKTDRGPTRLADAPWFAPPHPKEDADPVVVIGGGIAGAAVCDALAARGRKSLLVARVGDAPSPPIALIGPRLTMGRDAFARFWIEAHLDAVREIDAREGDEADRHLWAEPRGLRLDAAAIGQDADRLARHLRWPEDWLRRDGGTGPGEPDFLHLPKAGAVDGPRLLDCYAAAACKRVDAEVAALSQDGHSDGSGYWSLLSRDGTVIANATTVVLACGAFTAPLLPEDAPPLPFRFDAGHVGILPQHSTNGRKAAQSVLAQGYATAAVGNRVAVGATAARLDTPAIPVEDAETRAMLLAKARVLGLSIESDAACDTMEIWSGIRTKLPDHMPVAGGVPNAAFYHDAYGDIGDGNRFKPYPAACYHPGLYMLVGLGTRGFQAAPILAAHLASEICGTASPLPRGIRHALHPARFLIRQLKRGLKHGK